MTGVSREIFKKFCCFLFRKHWHWFPKGETTQFMLTFFHSSALHLQWVIAQIALSSLAGLLWNKSKSWAQKTFPCGKHTSFSLVRATCLYGSALSWAYKHHYCRGEYSQEPTLHNQTNLPTLCSPPESSGPHTTIHKAGEQLDILLTASLVKYLSSQTWKSLVRLKAWELFSHR